MVLPDASARYARNAYIKLYKKTHTWAVLLHGALKSRLDPHRPSRVPTRNPSVPSIPLQVYGRRGARSVVILKWNIL